MENTLSFLYQQFKESTGISTDTRKIQEGTIFFALKGENFNANQFALKALESGAKWVVIDEKEFEIEGRSILVDDVLSTLQKLAKHHREQLPIPVIGLTGSNGKTTTKELINAVLSKKYKTLATAGNLNNHIGVPLTLLSIDEKTELAIIEMGANHVGEIDFLCSLSKPTHGLITNIGKAHVGEFGSFENIIRAKSELYHFLIKNEGQVFINSREEILMNMSKRFSKPLFYPKKGDYYHCEYLSADPFVKLKTESGQVLQTNLMGKYNFDNIATALCLGKYFEVPEEDTLEAIINYQPSNNRSQIVQKGTNTIILDAYNANPSSMEVALQNLAEMNGVSKMVILGDMFELGEETIPEHKKIGSQLKKYNFNQAIVCGTNMKVAQNEYPGAVHFTDKESLINYLKTIQIDDSIVLLKGSRGMGLEKILDYL